MRKKRLILFISCLVHFTANAGDGDYPVSSIAPQLLKNANAVLRMEKLRLEVISPGKLQYTNHYAITILNEAGDGWADFSEYYDKFRSISSVEGILYNAEGKQVKKIKTKDVEDLSGVSGGSLIDDNRVKHHNFYHRVYPYTVEYKVELDMNSSLFFPGWVPQGKDKLSVEQSSVTIVTPASYEFRYKAFNYPGEPVKTIEKGKNSSIWSVKDLPAIIQEPYSPQWHEQATMVVFAPSDFVVDDYKGNMTSWAEFGKFVHSLKQGRDVLPDAIKQKVQQLISGVSDEKQKIAILYEYLQKNTRYISIQLGIGGWQPFDAKFVAAKAYGDCKALTNYMYALLKEAGIRSVYTLVRAGSNAKYITADFPSQQFNHVILCVPRNTDTTWLECTSQTLAPGYLSDFTSNRYALLVDENGGQLVRTPVYGLNENLQQRKIKATLDGNGTLKMNVKTRYTGLQQDNIHGMINNLSKDKIKEYLHEQLDFATYDILSFNYKEERASLPSVDESLEMSVTNYATMTGKRLFLVPNVMTRVHSRLAPDENRKHDIVFHIEYRDVDSVDITIPDGFAAESMPQDVNVNTKFGKYYSSVKLNGNTIQYYRSIERYAGRFPAKDYGELVKFHETIYKADRNKAVLLKQEGTKGF